MNFSLQQVGKDRCCWELSPSPLWVGVAMREFPLVWPDQGKGKAWKLSDAIDKAGRDAILAPSNALTQYQTRQPKGHVTRPVRSPWIRASTCSNYRLLPCWRGANCLPIRRCREMACNYAPGSGRISFFRVFFQRGELPPLLEPLGPMPPTTFKPNTLARKDGRESRGQGNLNRPTNSQ